MTITDSILHPTAPLGHVARVLPSGVDKKTHDGEVPVRLCNYTDIYYHDRITADLPFMEATATDAEIRRFTLRPGDVVMTKDSETAGDIAIPALVAEDLGGVVLGYHNALVRPDPTKVEPGYLFWALMGRQSAAFFETKARGVTRVGLRADDLAALPVPLPSLDVQRRVADMLDAETARIDTLIAKNTEVLQLAQIHEASAIAEALPDCGLSRSKGTPVGRLRWLPVVIQTGPFGSQLHAEDYVEGGWPVINPSNLIEGRLVPDPRVTVSDETREGLARHALKQGDVVFGRRGEMGRAGIATEDETGWLCGTGCLLVRFLHAVYDADFLLEVLSSHGVRAWFDQRAKGTTMANLNEEILGALPVPVIAIDEQRSILSAVRVLRARHQRVSDRIRYLIDLLRTRRQALITAAVTGQITV